MILRPPSKETSKALPRPRQGYILVLTATVCILWIMFVLLALAYQEQSNELKRALTPKNTSTTELPEATRKSEKPSNAFYTFPCPQANGFSAQAPAERDAAK